MPLAFEILGPLTVRRDGEPLDLGGRRQRLVLALLLLHRDRTLSPDEAIEALWGSDPPATARTAVHVVVSRLRALLGDPDALRTTPHGYALRIAAEQLDLHRFEALAGAGRLEEALALWRGPPLEDLRFEASLQHEIRRLEELRVTAAEDLFDARLDLGHGAEIVAELERHVAEHPFRERLRAQLMHALYRAGRQADALAAYRSARETFVDELGVEPGPRLREMEGAILAEDPSLVAPAAQAPAAPVPAPATALLGREAELEAAAAKLARPEVRLLTVTGPPGAGKTRFAQELARATGTEAAYVELAGVDDPELAAAEIARALAAPEAGELTARAALAAHLAPRRMLLVLDNVEHLLPEASTLVAHLLARAPELRVLATGRRPLRISAEHELALEPLAPGAAARLFHERAGMKGPQAGSDDAVAELCRRLDRLPLAIELAAARTRTLTPEALLARLDRRLATLTGGASDLPARQRSLRTALEWSYDLLGEAERRVLALVSAFAGGFTLEAAEAVAGEALLDSLETLVESSLVRWREGRYEMLETVREFAAEQLADPAAAATAHARHFLDLAETAAAELHRGPGQVAALEAIDADYANLRTALGRLAESDPPAALSMAISLSRFWLLRGQLSEGRHWLRSTLDATEAPPDELRARALHAMGPLAALQGDADAARTLLEEALALHRARGDEARAAAALGNLGIVVGWSDPAAGRRHLEDAIAVKRGLGDESGAAIQLVNLAGLVLPSDPEHAAEAAGESLALAREAGDTDTEASALHHLGLAALERGPLPVAGERIAEALRLAARLGYADRAADSMVAAAALLLRLGRVPAAAETAADAQALRAGGSGRFEPLERALLERVVAELPREEAERAQAAGTLPLGAAVERAVGRIAGG